MARRTITFAADTTKKFVANQRRGEQYHATIQNLTTQTITITVTNEDSQDANATFDTPAAGALTVTAGAVGVINEAYDGWLLTATSTSGTVNIVEAG